MATSAVDRYIRAARAAGCPRDQIANMVRAGAVLQPKQLQASSITRLCDAPGGPTEIGYGGARGGGKSHWMLVQMAVDDCQRFPGLKCLMLRKVGKALKEGFEDLLRRTLGNLPYRYVPSNKTLEFDNGSKIVLGHFQKESDVDAYLGLEYDIIGVEEATTLSASKMKMIRTCNRSSKEGWRPRMYFTTNPGGLGHVWFKDRFILPSRANNETETRFIAATVLDNRMVNADYKGQLEKLTGWQRRAWLEGDWDIAAGQFYTTFRRDVHVIEPFPERRIPDNWPVWCSLDYGFTHYTTCYLMTEGDGTLYILDEHAKQQWLVERHAEAIKNMLERWGVELTQLRSFVAGADVFAKRQGKQAVTTIADEYADYGIKLTTANNDRINGAGEILRRLGDVQADIAPRMYITELCPGLIETLPLLQHDPSNPEDVLKWDTDEDGIGGDDWYDGGRYGVMNAFHKPKVVTATPIVSKSIRNRFT